MQHPKQPNRNTKHQHQHRQQTRQNNKADNPNETKHQHIRRRSKNTNRADTMTPKINTKPYQNIISEVIIDDREVDRIPYALEQYHELNPHKEHLPIGDYIFKSPKDTMVVFEYKTGNDFITSIENNHLHNQYYDMVVNYDYPFIIVVAENLKNVIDERYYSTGLDMSLSQINGAIAEYTVNSTVLFAQTQYQAFDLMMRISGKIFINKPLRYKYGKKTKNTALNYLSSIRGIGSKAETICTTLNLKNLTDLMNLTVNDLTQIDGIGKITAENIIKAIQ